MSKASKNTSHRKLFTVVGDAPFQFVEAYKSLRTNLEFLSSAGNCKTILITSSVPEEGKTNVAVNLAMTIAASGKRVVLVDCDLRKATISRYLRIPRNHTLRGPFNRLHTAGSQHSRLSVSASSAVISTSTVSHLFSSIRINYTLSASFVNPLIAHKAVLFQKYRQIKILPQGLQDSPLNTQLLLRKCE